MKRIIFVFVLLCVAMVSLTGVADAYDWKFIRVPIDGKGSPDIYKQVTGYSVTPSGQTILIAANNVPKHVPTEDDVSSVDFWIGFGVVSIDANACVRYQFNDEDSADNYLTGKWSVSELKAHGIEDSGNSDKNFDSFYFGLGSRSTFDGVTYTFKLQSGDVIDVFTIDLSNVIFEGETRSTTPTETQEEEKEPEEPTVEQIQSANAEAAEKLSENFGETTVEAVKDAISDIEVPLSDYDLEKFAENVEAIEKDREAESSGEVVDAKTPAASDLPVSEAIAAVNELSTKPKVTEPEALKGEALETAKENLKAIVTSKASDTETLTKDQQAAIVDIPNDFDPEEIQEVTGDSITIEPLSKNLDDQAAIISDLFDKIGELLTTALKGLNEGDEGGKYGSVIATAMPTMTPNTTGYFPMKINMRHLTPGKRPRFWPSVEHFRRATVSGVASLAGEEGDAFFLDENGNPTATISGDASNMTVVPFLKEGVPYDSAFITVDATQDDQKKLKKLLADNQTETEEPKPETSSGSGGGCEVAGLGFGALAALAALMKATKKR